MILIINTGSSSLKYHLYPADLSYTLAHGLIARIGESDSPALITFHGGDAEIHDTAPIADHAEAFARMVRDLTSPEHGVMDDLSAITAVGHRTVHGGDKFVDSTLVTDDVLAKLEELTVLAPLHNPPNITGIREAQRLLPNVPQVAAFDTAFHHSLPEHAYVFALPYDLYEKHGIRRFGFHGLSCRYVAGRAASLLDRPIEDLRMVVCHLGNGVTIDAVAGGKSVDTSIGFGTFSGVMMGTRSGDFDPAVIFHLARELHMSLDEIEQMIFKKSGLLGVSGVSNDMREILAKAQDGNKRCALAADMFVYGIKKHIGAYAAAMGGIDALIFTAGIGENSPEIRARVCQGLEFLGASVDEQVNQTRSKEDRRISLPGSRLDVLVIPTDEEQMIAIDTVRLTQKAAPQPKRRVPVAAE